MTVVLVDVHEYVHTCPADPVELHPVQIWREVISAVPGGPCQAPVTYRFNDRLYTVPCRDLRVGDKQCPACRVIVWTQSTTVHHDTSDDVAFNPADRPAMPPAPDTTLIPCPTCGTPMAAFLGVHLLCPDPIPAVMPVALQVAA